MKLTVFGATGGTGTFIVMQALAAGHEVTAVVRDPARLKAAPGQQLRVVTADVMDPASIIAALDGADVVVNTVGPRGTGPTTIIRDSVRSILEAMGKSGTRRLLHVSGSIAADAGESWYLRYLLKPVARATFLRHVCADMRDAEQQIRASDLDWTIFRPPALSAKPARGSYRTAIDRNVPRGFAVTRGDLATCMLARLDDPAMVHRFIGVANLQVWRTNGWSPGEREGAAPPGRFSPVGRECVLLRG
jgi:putative NADH-flavin reductase